jgi:putative flippase GtrA
MFSLLKIREYIQSNTFIKFCLIGVINTIVGFSIIFSLLIIFGINYLISNFLGYIGGVIVSFILNKYVNFKSEGHIKFEFPVFFLSFIIAYSVDMLVLYSLVEYLHQSKIIGIIIASAVYTILFYLSARYIVFQKRQ